MMHQGPAVSPTTWLSTQPNTPSLFPIFQLIYSQDFSIPHTRIGRILGKLAYLNNRQNLTFRAKTIMSQKKIYNTVIKHWFCCNAQPVVHSDSLLDGGCRKWLEGRCVVCVRTNSLDTTWCGFQGLVFFAWDRVLLWRPGWLSFQSSCLCLLNRLCSCVGLIFLSS